LETLRLTVRNRLGLHARPAALFVRTAGRFDARVEVENLTRQRGPAGARSLSGLATLGVRMGDEILVRAVGEEASGALKAIEELAADNFGDAEEEVPAQQAPASVAAAGDHRRLIGRPGSPGRALGPLRRALRRRIEIPDTPGGEGAEEWAALQTALQQARGELDELRSRVAARSGDYEAAIFDAQALLLEDESLLDEVRDSLERDSSSAARAWSNTVRRVADRYRDLDDELQRARATDVEDVGERVLGHLTGAAPRGPLLKEPGILVAPELTPADTASLDPELVRGIATAFGGPTSHSAILARSLGLPAAVGFGESLLSLAEGVLALLDGEAGTLELEPSNETIARFDVELVEAERIEQEARAAAHQPAVTRDGHRVEMAGNAGSLADVRAVVAAGGEGVGLLRTEFLFLGRDAAPSEDEQFEAYLAVLEALEGRPLVIRTLDVGADKPLPFVAHEVEANPFLGERGVRLVRSHPALMRTQLRAVVRASVHGDVRVMFPMVSTLAELRSAFALLDEAVESQSGGSVPGRRPPTGVMIEVPSAALLADAFARECDFFSIGTNDLAQYTLAADRTNERVSELGDALHPAVLTLIERVVGAAHRHTKRVAVCGEVAADPIAIPVLVGLGVDELSMNAPAIARAKRLVRALSASDAEGVARSSLDATSPDEVRDLVRRRIEGS
ncbi:MAG: phosphoenolpyruvate--protein phosphotransferase, partial [Actinomycetota bacterium]